VGVTTARDHLAYHLMLASDWDTAPADAPLRRPSLDHEGFIHLTHGLDQMSWVADQFYRDVPGPHVVLTVALDRLTAPWRYDGDERFPHVYGPIERSAIVSVRPVGRNPDGTYRLGDPDAMDLEALVFDALERLPPVFRERLGSVAIVIEEEPTAVQLASVGARGLYGLYEGVPRTAYGADHAAVPSKITLFRGPLLRGAPTPAAVADRVADTVYHEIAHHFGISDARLHEVRRGAR
jgi:predicted Zn-dependent protease with MMP-like domain/uncharacterized protein (DUF952 family)